MIKEWAYLLETSENYRLNLQAEQMEQFVLFLKLLQEWNTKMNLTAIDDDEGIIIKHFIDSLIFLKKIDIKNQWYILDLGTGAGFPGIPLKIWRPELEIVLVDSLQKRINFLREIVERLNLTKVKLIHGRAEDLAQMEDYREKFDCVVSRAVANLRVLSEYCLPFVKIGGFFAGAKGPDLKQELMDAHKAILILGGQVAEEEYYELPYLREQRSLIKIAKIKSTPKKYPRKAGMPSKKPL
ncbi:MAG: 16S rRNA (guanine(527)-N(7))-methyltransferase RsmG [Zhaonellaceae bacterium]|jgi:16S rRNA (guanine527-N7)-methyltransferase|nr:16S rRNA (guanine(527)-N(7))-methyltransferase RsmG [Clostridia bacterium]